MNTPNEPPLSGRLTPFVGRQTELQQLLDLSRDPGIRMVTLVGAGGIGKTRLALEAARLLKEQFQNGVYFLPLSSLNSIDELLPALAEGLGIRLPPGGDLQQAVLDHLRDQQKLLILDNFEHMLEEAPLVTEILAAAPQVRALVTSREKLGLEVETLYHLDGLKLPPGGFQEGERYDALQLFQQKARQARPSFALTAGNLPAVVRICRLVGGNPLGILLASSWVEHFSPEEIFAEITGSLDFLSRSVRDAEPRHAGMRAVFDSSFRQLDEHHKDTFRKLACFRGGFDLAAARAIAHADLKTLITLVDKSLLSRNPDSGRYDLHELLRQYANEELAAAGEREAVIEAHFRYYMTFLREREPRLISREQTKALDEIQADFDNIRQAFSVAIERRDAATAQSVLPSLYAFCDMRSKFYEGESLFRLASEGLAPLPGEIPSPAWALALLSWYDMRIYFERFDSFEEIESQAQNCLQQARLASDPVGMAAGYVLLGAIAEGKGEFKTAIRNYKKGMRAYPLLDDAYWVNMRTGLAHLEIQEYPPALRAFETSLKRGQETGERVKTGWSFLNIGLVLMRGGNPGEALSYLQRACSLFEEVGTTIGVLWANYYSGEVSVRLGNTARAREFTKIAGEIAQRIHSASWIRKTDELLERIDPQFSPVYAEAKIQDFEPFSPRELEVLQLLKSELRGPEIARSLVVSLNTVRFHTKNIYQKLGVNNRLEAIQKARELGL